MRGHRPHRREDRSRGRIFGRGLALASLLSVAAAIALVVLAAGHKPSAGRLARDSNSVQLDASKTVQLWWVGDIALSTQLGLPEGGLTGALSRVRGLLRWGQVGTGNLEGTLSTRGPDKCGPSVIGVDCYAFQAPPSYAFQFASLGFTMMNQANNHSMDFGEPGRAQTVAALDRAHVGHTGYPGEISYLTVHGIRVAFLGFAPWPFDSDMLDTAADAAMVRSAKQRASVVVVFMHDGAEGPGQTQTPNRTEYFDGEDRGNPRLFAHAMINAGASVILGSGPHVIRGVEDYKGHLIAYSAGNFEGENTLGSGGVLDDSAIVRVQLSATGKLLAAQWIPITLVGGRPYFDPTGASVRLVTRLSDEDFPTDHFRIERNGRFDL